MSDAACPVEYSHEYDAYFCMACNQRLEGQCGDPECEFCAGRPAKPLGEAKTEIVEKVVMRVLFYPQTKQVVAHIYDAMGRLKYRPAVDAHESGSFRSPVALLLAALGAKVESDAKL